jgi:hypothetical protein
LDFLPPRNFSHLPAIFPHFKPISGIFGKGKTRCRWGQPDSDNVARWRVLVGRCGRRCPVAAVPGIKLRWPPVFVQNAATLLAPVRARRRCYVFPLAAAHPSSSVCRYLARVADRIPSAPQSPSLTSTSSTVSAASPPHFLVVLTTSAAHSSISLVYRSPELGANRCRARRQLNYLRHCR